MSIEEQKPIISFDIKQPNGLIYLHTTAPEIIVQILKNDIGGVILPKDYNQEDYMNPTEHQFKIQNPKMVLENDIMMLVGDVIFNENVEKPKGYWRLVLCGNGTIEDGVVTKIEKISAINIEIIEEMVYNTLSERIKR